jgi:hypothetical protein
VPSARVPRTSAGQYKVKSPHISPVVSPIRTGAKDAYPDSFIYLNRESKLRPFVMTPPTTNVEILSEISPEAALSRITRIQEWLDANGIVPPDLPGHLKRDNDSSYDEDDFPPSEVQ